MIVEVTFSNTQYIRAKSLHSGIRRAKKQYKALLGDSLYKALITDVTAREIPEREFVPHKEA